MKLLYLGLMTGENGFTQALKRNFTEYKELNCGDSNFNSKAIRFAVDFKPDVIFIQIQAPNIITEETAIALKANCNFVINWTGDLRSPIPQWYFDIGQHIDLTCFSNMQDVKEFKSKGLGSEYLEIGFNPEIYKPEGEKLTVRDIVFLGNNYEDLFPLSGYRKSMVEFLKYQYPYDFGLYGSGWTVCSGNVNHSQHEEAKLYRGAKIAINLSHFDYERYNSDRILRIMGSGVMCLAKRYKGMEIDYSPGVNLAVWDNLDELKHNIDYYLKNENERIEIARRGNAHVNKFFTFEQMALNIKKLVK